MNEVQALQALQDLQAFVVIGIGATIVNAAFTLACFWSLTHQPRRIKEVVSLLGPVADYVGDVRMSFGHGPGSAPPRLPQSALLRLARFYEENK